jgi:DegV family protein with EDD domain
MRNFDLLVDSSSDLSLELVNEFGINLIPMTFTLGETDYQEDFWKSISPADFYSRAKSGEKSMTTQLNADAFMKYFSKSLEAGRDVLFICLSRGLSASYDNACIAAKDAMEKYPGRTVRAINSLGATLGHGLLTLMAAQKGDSGASVNEAADYIEDVKHKVFALFTVDDLMFLHKGGRLSRTAAVAGTMLGVKPVLWINPEGELKQLGKTRGRKAAIEMLADNMSKAMGNEKKLSFVCITHGDCPEDAEALKKILTQRFEIERVIINVLGAVIGAHSGPGTIALFFEGNMTRTSFSEQK